jgi:hypothetical protein
MTQHQYARVGASADETDSNTFIVDGLVGYSRGAAIASLIDSRIPGIDNKYKVSWMALQPSSENSSA